MPLSNWPIRRPLILVKTSYPSYTIQQVGARLMCNLDRLHWMKKKVGSLSKKRRQPRYQGGSRDQPCSTRNTNLHVAPGAPTGSSSTSSSLDRNMIPHGPQKLVQIQFGKLLVVNVLYGNIAKVVQNLVVCLVSDSFLLLMSTFSCLYRDVIPYVPQKLDKVEF